MSMAVIITRFLFPIPNRTMPARNTRKNNLSEALRNDPLFAAMNRGNIAWGDLMAQNAPVAKSAKAAKSASPVSTGPWSATNALEDYAVPELLQRKDIWTKFPVVLDKIASRNGTDRYAITWHTKNLKEYRDQAQSFDEWSDFTNWTETRLLHALRAHPRTYLLEIPESPDQIAIIAMVHAEGNAPRANSAKTRKNTYNGPVLRKLNDIKDHFPVVWHAVEGRPGKSTYAIELFGKKIKEISAVARRDMSSEIKAALLDALKASKAWHVLPAVGKEACRIEIA